MKEETDAILRSLGDLLLQLGCDTGWLVPNTSLSTKQLNASIAAYQFLLDKMEFDIISATIKAQQNSIKPEPEPEPIPEPEAAVESKVVPEEPDNADQNQDLANFGDNDMDNGFSGDLDFYDMNRSDNLGVFDDVGSLGTGMDTSKLGDGTYGMIDDYF